MTEERIAELELLARRACPGVWTSGVERQLSGEMQIVVRTTHDGLIVARCGVVGDRLDAQSRADAEFFVAASDGVSALIATVREQECEINSLREALDSVRNAAAAVGF